MSKTTRLLLSVYVLLLAASCTKLQHISFNVKTPGIKTGVFIIKNDEGQIAFSANIKGSQLKLDSQVIEQEGYYTLLITDDEKKQNPEPFEIYLQPGHYNITTDVNDATVYPKINAPSLVQKELSVYYNAVTMLNSPFYQSKIMKALVQTLIRMPKDQLFELAKKAQTAKASQNNELLEQTDKKVLQEFIKQNPNSLTAVHLMTKMEFDNDAAVFYKLFNNLSPEAKSTDEAKALGKKLSLLAKLIPGGLAPGIAGATPDGKLFKITELNKKIYLVEFWKSANELSRTNHSVMDVANMLSTIDRKKDVGMISISLDEKRDWWTGAIKDDHLTWPQYSDLKGNESVNAANWGITRIPTYYLLDGGWHIIERDIPKAEVPVVINEYLKHH